jgi:hypothetical protein
MVRSFLIALRGPSRRSRIITVERRLVVFYLHNQTPSPIEPVNSPHDSLRPLDCTGNERFCPGAGTRIVQIFGILQMSETGRRARQVAGVSVAGEEGWRRSQMAPEFLTKLAVCFAIAKIRPIFVATRRELFSR